MLIHEKEYQEDNHANFQERTVEYDSWDDYIDNLLCALDGFIITDNFKDNYFRGEWYHPVFRDIKLIHEANKINALFKVTGNE